MVKVNRDASVSIQTTLSLHLYLQRDLTQDETMALVKHLRRTLPVTTLDVREEQHLHASWTPK
jgi:hypothetical protein